MGRQLFLHHYLPAHLASALVTGALLEFVFNLDNQAIEDNFVAQVQGKSPGSGGSSSSNGNAKTKLDRSGKRSVMPAKERMGSGGMMALWAASGVVLSLVIAGWWWFLPLTYGKPGLTAEQVQARKWLGYDLHFAK